MRHTFSLTLTAVSLPCAVMAGTPPNIVIIMCDDLGYGDVGCYGQQLISTPHIDSMAARGMRFTQAYAGSPVSAPSRATLMTGQHTGHTHVRGNKEYRIGRVMMGQTVEPAQTGQEPYDTARIILPEIMKSRGYATAVFGKWAGGYEGSPSTPDKRGVDEFVGYICQFQAHAYYPNFLNAYSRSAGDTAVWRMVLTDNVAHPIWGPGYEKRTQYAADIIHSKAKEWLASRSPGSPFAAFLTYTLPHAELCQPDDSLVERYRRSFATDRDWVGQEGSRYNATTHTRAQFAAMVSRLDAYVGEIIALLRERGLAENTLVIFTSDNGPHEEGGADPAFFAHDGSLRGLKRSTYEGGIRVPFIALWPGTIPAGAVSSHQLAFYDMMPTFCDLAGIRHYERRFANANALNDSFDGISFAPTLTGRGRQREHSHLYFEFSETRMFGVRQGDWKLVVRRGVAELYDLSSDPSESHNVAARYPDVVARLKDIIYREHTDNASFPIALP